MRFLKTIYFFLLPNALVRVNFSLRSCQLENSRQVRRNNELHYSDQRKEDMSNTKRFPLTRVQKYTPSRETRKKVARMLPCTHLHWPHSQDLKTLLCTQLPVACKPLSGGDGNVMALCLLNEKEGLKARIILWPLENMSMWVVCLLLRRPWCPVSYSYLWSTYKPSLSTSETWSASRASPLEQFSLAGKTSAFVLICLKEDCILLGLSHATEKEYPTCRQSYTYHDPVWNTSVIDLFRLQSFTQVLSHKFDSVQVI